MGIPNWSRLVESGRAKGIGLPWTDAELKARYEFKIPADYVRKGCLTIDTYEKEMGIVKEVEAETGVKPLFHMTKVELIAEAQKKGLVFTDEATRTELIHLLANSIAQS